jgi:NhaP-type Na+/H+ and K+/H+ antiporter
MKYKKDLTPLVSKLKDYNKGTYDKDDLDEFIMSDLERLNIDVVVKNDSEKNPNYSGFIEENDSLIIFIKRSTNMFSLEKRIIYDYNKKPRNFGNKNIINASYKIKQLDERLYYSEEGFD